MVQGARCQNRFSRAVEKESSRVGGNYREATRLIAIIDLKY